MDFRSATVEDATEQALRDYTTDGDLADLDDVEYIQRFEGGKI